MFTGCWFVPPGPSGSLFFSLPASCILRRSPTKNPAYTNPLSPAHAGDLFHRHTRTSLSTNSYAKPLPPRPKALHPLLTSLRTNAPQDARIQIALKKYKRIFPFCQVLFRRKSFFFFALSPFCLSPQRLLCSYLTSIIVLLVLNGPACKRTRYRPLATG